jgi:alpha-glucosidase
MGPQWNRRDVLKGFFAASSAMIVPKHRVAQSAAAGSGYRVEIQITSVSANTFRLSILPVNNGSVADIPSDGSLVQESWGVPIAKLRTDPTGPISVGSFRLKISLNPVGIGIANEHGDVIQQFAWDENAGTLSFLKGASPLLGFGEGGPQFDRRGSTDSMRSGQGAYKLATHGGRVPIPWIIGTSGWAIFFHQPYGSFDFTGPQGKFQSASLGSALGNMRASQAALSCLRCGVSVINNRTARSPAARKCFPRRKPFAKKSCLVML